MTQEISKVEAALIQGDLNKLSPEERISYYRQVCESLELNPYTKPFDYLTFQGKLKLYATRDCMDQLRKKHKVTLQIVSAAEQNGLYVVHARASLPDGRQDEDYGVVNIANLKGDAAANAMLKAVTKAKRRVTLSVCGLGFLDETEVNAPVQHQASTVVVDPAKQLPVAGNNAKPGEASPPVNNGASRFPVDGAELEARLKKFEAKLIAEKRCVDGQLMSWVWDAVKAHLRGNPSPMVQWGPELVRVGFDAALQFDKQHPAAAKKELSAKEEIENEVLGKGFTATTDRLLRDMAECGIDGGDILRRCKITNLKALTVDHLVDLRTCQRAIKSGRAKAHELFALDAEPVPVQPATDAGANRVTKATLAELNRLADDLQLSPPDRENLCASEGVGSLSELTEEQALVIVNELKMAKETRRQEGEREPGWEPEEVEY